MSNAPLREIVSSSAGPRHTYHIRADVTLKRMTRRGHVVPVGLIIATQDWMSMGAGDEGFHESAEK